MNTRSRIPGGLAAALLLLAACGKSDQQKQLEDAAQQVADAGKQMAEAMGGAGTGGDTKPAAEAVDFRELKNLLPEDLPGMKRTSAEGQRNATMGFAISTAEGDYSSEEGPSLRITITDVGAMAGVGAMAAYAWSMTDIDRETESGYERTVTIDGHRGYETWNEESRSGQVQVLVAGRFVVEVDGNDVSMDDVKAALRKVDLGKLAGMKDVGR